MSKDSEEPVIVIDTSMTLAKVLVTGASCRAVDHKGKVIVPEGE
jgi:hypothetical protein